MLYTWVSVGVEYLSVVAIMEADEDSVLAVKMASLMVNGLGRNYSGTLWTRCFEGVGNAMGLIVGCD